MFLSNTLYPLLSTGSIQEDKKLSIMTEKLLTVTSGLQMRVCHKKFLFQNQNIHDGYSKEIF